MKNKIIIAPVSKDSDIKTLMLPIKEFPLERLVLLATTEGSVRAETLKKEIEKLSIPVSIVRVKNGNPWEEFFIAGAEALEGQDRNNVIINISTADRISQCALTNLAHVNGFKAIAIIDGKMMMLPILKLSLEAVLSEKKIRILEELNKGKCSGSLEDLAKSTGMSLQLLSYHVKGTPKAEGLKQLELVEIEQHKGRMKVCLSTMGKLFMKGYLKN